MSFLRLSLMHPLPGKADEVRKVQERILAGAPTIQGFVLGLQFSEDREGGQIGRLPVWEPEEDASRAGGAQNLQAMRSELLLLTEPEHQDMAFRAVDVVYHAQGS